jgi:hypothetical protein
MSDNNGKEKDLIARVVGQMSALRLLQYAALKQGFSLERLSKDPPRNLPVEVGRQGKRVIINFNQKIRWIGLEPGQAIKMAAAIAKNVEEIQREFNIGKIEADGSTEGEPR